MSQLTAFVTRKSASSTTKALQKAMHENESITEAFYKQAVERTRQHIAAKRDPLPVSLFNDEHKPKQQIENNQYSLF